jgi:hypothetical protein
MKPHRAGINATSKDHPSGIYQDITHSFTAKFRALSSYNRKGIAELVQTKHPMYL